MQTKIRRTVPCRFARTRCKLGFQRRLVLLFAWLTLLPTEGPLPQTLQILAMVSCSRWIDNRVRLPQLLGSGNAMELVVPAPLLNLLDHPIKTPRRRSP